MIILLKLINDKLLFEKDGEVLYSIQENNMFMSSKLSLTDGKEVIVEKSVKSIFLVGRLLIDLYFVKREKHYYQKINSIWKYSLKVKIEKNEYLLIYHPKQLISIYNNDEMIGYIKDLLPPYPKNIVKKIVLNDDVNVQEIAACVMGIIDFGYIGYSEPEYYFGFQLKKFNSEWRPTNT